MARPQPRLRWSRTALTTLLIIVSCAALLTSVLTTWAARTVLDSDRVAAAVDRSLEDPAVTDALGEYVSEQLQSALDRSNLVDRLVPELLSGLEPVIRQTLAAAIDREARDLAESPQTRVVVVEASRRAHATVLRVLDGDPPDRGLVTVVDGRVALNLVPVVGALVRRVQSNGLFESLEVPVFDATQTPAEQIAAFGAALRLDLPPDFAQLTVYERQVDDDGSLLATAQRVLRAVRTLIWLPWVVTLLLVAAVFMAATRKRRAAWWLGLGAMTTGFVAHLVMQKATRAVPELVSNPAARAATARLVENAVTHLDRRMMYIVVGSGALIALLTLLGRQSGLPASEMPAAPSSRTADVVRYAGLAVGLVVLVVFGLSWSTAVAAAIIAVAAFAVPIAAGPERDC